jgi:hypothetical protein
MGAVLTARKPVLKKERNSREWAVLKEQGGKKLPIGEFSNVES